MPGGWTSGNLARYRAQFARRIAVEQANDKPGHLRDFAVAHRAFTYATADPTFRTQVAKALGPQALVYGWGDDEYRWVSGLSRANATGGPADWCVNLSALQKLPAGRLRRPRRPLPETKEGTRTIAFVVSDGDNLQWLCGNFVGNARYWDSPLRGTFPMTWEAAPAARGSGASRPPASLRHRPAKRRLRDGRGCAGLHLPAPPTRSRRARPAGRAPAPPVRSRRGRRPQRERWKPGRETTRSSTCRRFRA